MKKILVLIALSSLFLTFQNCQTPPAIKYTKDGNSYGVVKGLFRERWWNFYDRGLSFSEGKFWKEAIADFQEAVKKRDKDQRWARTYGMHFVDYFPHRDLGVAYYHIKEYENALEELEYSLSTVDTGKTKFYLNKVLRAILKRTTTDQKPPVIKIAELEKEKITNKFSITIKGEVEDDTYTSSITINNTPLFIELAAKRIPFAKKIKLKRGTNEIIVTAKDLTGKTSEKVIMVVADFIGPSINISNYMNGDRVGKEKIVLTGSLSDDAGIVSLTINHVTREYDKKKEVTFSHPLCLKRGDNKIMISATDIAGNETRGEFYITYVPGMDNERRKSISKRLLMLADLNLGILDTGGNPVVTKRITPENMKMSPIIKMNDLTESQTVFYDTIFIDGSAVAVNRIARIEINNEPVIIRPGKNIYFSYLIQLQEGENKFTIKAVDTNGLETSKSVTIFRKVPRALDIGSRMSVAILPLVHKGALSPAATMVDDGLIESFVELNRFNLVSRSTELKSVLRELKLSQTELFDKSRALRVGKLVAAEAILTGSVIETNKDIEIAARLINTETSTVMAAYDVYGQEKSLSHIHFLLNGLAIKFKHAFPVVEGLVVKIEGNELFINLGKKQNLKKEMKFIVYRKGEDIIHPISDKVLGCDTEILGEATVVQVFDDMSKGKIALLETISKIKKMDPVITK